jgi:hypothetical protein
MRLLQFFQRVTAHSDFLLMLLAKLPPGDEVAGLHDSAS